MALCSTALFTTQLDIGSNIKRIHSWPHLYLTGGFYVYTNLAVEAQAHDYKHPTKAAPPAQPAMIFDVYEIYLRTF